MKLIADVNFDMSYSFIFSARPGTPAADMVDDVPEEEEKSSVCIFCKSVSNQQAWHGAMRRPCSALTQRIRWKARRVNIMELSGRTENNRVVN